MGQIYLYTGIGKEKEIIKSSGVLREILPDVNFDTCVILKAGRRLTADYVVQDDDVIFVRVTPTAMTAAIIVAVVGIVAVGIGIAGEIVQKQRQEQQEEMEKAQQQAEELAKKALASPFLKGTKNKTALGYAIPYIMGETYMSPYLLSNGSYSLAGTDGKKQYWSAVLCAGYNELLIKSLSIGNTVIKTWIDTAPQNGVYTLDNSTFYDAENLVEIRQSGDFTNSVFNQKVVSESYGDELAHDFGGEAKPVIKECAENTMAVEVGIMFQGLRKYNSDSGNWESTSATVVPYWSNNPDDATPTWHAFTFAGSANNKFTRNSNKEIRFIARKEFSAAEAYGKKISVKVVRETPKQEDSSQESCYLIFVQSFCYDAKKSSAQKLVSCAAIEAPYRDMTTRIGIRMIANENTQENLDEFNIIAAACARSPWSTHKTPTRNPADWILELLTSPHHKHSQFTETEIDLDSFTELYNYCEAENFHTDGVITEGKKKRETIEAILGNINAALIINNEGKLEAVIDTKESYPVALFNSQDVISVTVAKSLERKPDGRKVTFTNREAWKTDCIYVMRDGRTEKTDDDTVTELAVTYVTEAEHAYKIAHRQLAQEELQPREVQLQIGKDGDFYPLFSTVLLQLAQLRQGIASAVIHNVEITGSYITAVDISDTVEMVAGYRYGVIIQAMSTQGRKLLYAEVQAQEGFTRHLVLASPISTGETVLPQYGNVLSFGLLNETGDFDRITNTMKITQMEPNDDGWTLTLKDYNPALYEYGIIPEYKTNLTSPPSKKTTLPSVTPGQLQEAIAQNTPIGIKLRYSRDGVQWHTDYTADDVYKQQSVDGGKTWTPPIPGERIRGSDSPPNYILDLSPEMQTFPVDSDGVPLYSDHLTIGITLYYGTELIPHEKIRYIVYVNQKEIPAAADSISISPVLLTLDTNEIIVIAEYTDIARQARATITKLYAGEDGSSAYYKLSMSDSAIRVDTAGVHTPRSVQAQKRRVDKYGERNTDYGIVKVTTLPDGNTTPVNSYVPVGTDSYDSEKSYHIRYDPFMLKVSQATMLAAAPATAAVFFERSKT